jgi:hypothetical protein
LVDRKRQPFSRLRLPGASRSVEAQFADEARRIPLQVADIIDFYLGLVSELKALGF